MEATLEAKSPSMSLALGLLREVGHYEFILSLDLVLVGGRIIAPTETQMEMSFYWLGSPYLLVLCWHGGTEDGIHGGLF